jgi:hypothetical protein
VSQYQEAGRGLDIRDSARALVLLGTATADALVSFWRAKYDNHERRDGYRPQNRLMYQAEHTFTSRMYGAAVPHLPVPVPGSTG